MNAARRRSRLVANSVALAIGCCASTGGLSQAVAGSNGKPASTATGSGRATPPQERTVTTVRTGRGAPRRGGWPNKRFVYSASGKRLAEVLQDFSASEGLPAVIAEGVDGVVHGEFDTAPDIFLDALAKAYGIIWYHDGTTLYFYPARAMQSRLFRLKGFTRTQLEEMLSSLQILDPRYPLRYNERESTLLAYGPPRHIEAVSSALESLDTGASERNQITVRMFPLRYASAADRMLGASKLFGVVTTLRGVYGTGNGHGPDVPVEANQRGPQDLETKMKTLQQTYGGARMVPGLEHRTNDAAAPPPDKGPGATGRGLRSPVNLEDDQPVFEADEATNSIIVHGRQSKMSEYADLIHRLDVRPTLVELEATIIDVNADQAQTLGINWSVRGTKGGVSLQAPQPNVPDLVGGGQSAELFTLGTVWSNAGRELLTRVEALQAKGEARVVARPKVLGIANRSAHMQEKRVAAVRVAGNLEARLFQIEAGTMLDVMPQITYVDGTPHIKLTIYIEDGNFEMQQVDQIPVVKRTEIRTEAEVVEGESLLIGGITVETQSNNQAGVPGLSKVPLIGGLFRWGGSRSTRIERIFLITPRLLHDEDRNAPTSVDDPQASDPQPMEPMAPPASPRRVANRRR